MSDLQRVGPLAGAVGTAQPFTADSTAAQRVTDAHSRYWDSVKNGNVWLAANQAGAALSNLSATCTGFCLTNPAGSGKYLSLIEIGIVQTSTAATTANAGIQLAANVNPVASVVIHTTPLTVRNALVGTSASPVGLVDSAATLPAAPVAIMNLWQPSVSATATTAIPPVVIIPIDGKIMLKEGTSVSLSALSALSVAAHMVWEEIQIS
jgi:hypothetical protein